MKLSEKLNKRGRFYEGMMFLACVSASSKLVQEHNINNTWGRGGVKQQCVCSVPYQREVLFCLRTDRNIGGFAEPTHAIATPIVRNVDKKTPLYS